MLLVNHFKIPHTLNVDGKVKKLSLNTIMSMNWEKRKRLHDAMGNHYKLIVRQINWPELHDGAELRISYGFIPGKSTRNFDLDNLAYVIKVFNDAFTRHIGINDSYRHIVEVRTKALPKQEDECLMVQIELLNPIDENMGIKPLEQ